MNKEKILEYYENHKGEAIGTGIGLIFALLVLFVSLWKILFVIICCIAGYYLGKKGYQNKQYLREVLDRIIVFFKEK